MIVCLKKQIHKYIYWRIVYICTHKMSGENNLPFYFFLALSAPEMTRQCHSVIDVECGNLEMCGTDTLSTSTTCEVPLISEPAS